MRKRALPIRWLLLPVLALNAACNSEDAERMARVGHKVMEKAEALAPEADGNFSRGLQAIRPSSDATSSLEARVTARLRFDKNLSDADIQVHADKGAIELKGSVRDAAQRQRAIDLAESTVGVERVSDTLDVPVSTP